jgi:hypothetical protein
LLVFALANTARKATLAAASRFMFCSERTQRRKGDKYAERIEEGRNKTRKECVKE